MAWIRFLEKRFAADGYRVPELMRQIAASENFYRLARPAENTGGTSATLASMGALNEGTGP
jgi:hypothetical protein